MKSKQKRKKPESYIKRSYRGQSRSAGLLQTHVRIKETDLHIQADRDIQRRAEEIVLQCRLQLEDHIIRHPVFYSSLSPVPKDFASPPIIRDMYDAARKTGVGPMAAVAGGIAEYLGRKLLEEGVQEIIIENGGDIFIARSQPAVIAIFAGESPLSYRVGIELPLPMPWGVCTSSGTVGHSLSMGEADSVTVVARSALLADAAATRLGNEVCSQSGEKESVRRALAAAESIEGIAGVVVICGETLGAVGDIRLVRIGEEAVG